MGDLGDSPGGIDATRSLSDGPAPTVVAGLACLGRLADLPRDLARPAALIVADETVVRLGYTDRVRAALGDALHVRMVEVPAGEPTVESVDAVADAVRQMADPVVVAVGGGSTLDTAKLAAAVAGGGGGGVECYLLGAAPLPAGPPVIAIPTTAGTGSEVTRTCVLSDRHGHKVWAWGDGLLPRLVLLDPLATATMPPSVTAATGLDAFVHAVEAATGRRRSDAVTVPAREAVRLAIDHLPAAVASGADLDARAAMQRAALLAGVAIDGGGTGIAHSIGHALGSLAHAPHGVAVAVGLGAAIDWNVAGAADAFVDIAAAAGVPVDGFGAATRRLFESCGLASAVAAVGPLPIGATDLAESMVAPENRPMYDNNCRTVDDSSRSELAVAALELWDELATVHR